MILIKKFAKRQLKRFPACYDFVRYKKMQANRISSGLREAISPANGIEELLRHINLSPVFSRKKFPEGSLIEITNACNLNCLMCSTKKAKRPIGIMSLETFEIILKQLKTVGIDTAGLHTVGEPFMYKDLEGLFLIAKRNNFKLWISTNGQFPKRIEALYRQFPNMANSYRFSIDGATKQTYELIRQGALFSKLIESLEVIHRINKGNVNHRIMLTIDAVLSMTNINEMSLFFKTYEKYCWPEKINFHLINGLTPDQSFFKKDFPFLNLIRKNIPCDMPFEQIYFTHSGKVTLCCRDYEEDLVVGDIAKDNIKNIWNSQLAEDIRQKNLGLKKMDIKPCLICRGPYPLISDVINRYIHFLRRKYPRLSPEEFGQKVTALLSVMDLSMQKNDLDMLKKRILKAFKE